jgi:hypothetical protein
MKHIVAVVLLVMLTGSFVFAQTKQQTQEQNQTKSSLMEQNRLQQRIHFIDTNGDGVNDYKYQFAWTQKMKYGKGGYGPGDGTGNQGVGPRNGSGFGPGTGECDGTGPKGSVQRRGNPHR